MKKTFLALVATGVVLAIAGSALAAEGFSPEISFELSDTKIKGNPKVTVSVAQEDGEEELAKVQLGIPKGFILPPDSAIKGGEKLGSGSIVIDVGPGCRPGPEGAIPVRVPATLPATLLEADRTEDQEQAGVYAVWVLNIQGVTKINLVITGSKKAGWMLEGEIPANDNTCPPFNFDLTINSTSEGGTPIIVNPAKAGTKVFSGTFISADSPAIVTIEQPVSITK
jgi:hypothetical protein